MPDEKTGGAAKLARILRVFEKHQQLIHRHAPSFSRHVLEHFRQHSLNAAQATGQLGLSPRSPLRFSHCLQPRARPQTVTPQAKGKVEREHQFWQGRLPAGFASEKITEIEVVNPQIDARRAHRNAHEIHRELRQTPQRASNQARKEKRSVLRPAPRCPWWDYVWSVRTAIKIGSDGRGPIGPQRRRIEKPPETKVILCLHPAGHHSVLAGPPDPSQKPAVLFPNRPK